MIAPKLIDLRQRLDVAQRGVELSLLEEIDHIAFRLSLFEDPDYPDDDVPADRDERWLWVAAELVGELTA